ncbi:MAG: hypothetical protein ACTSRZ_20955 [Promethearchaeota archaeon]
MNIDDIILMILDAAENGVPGKTAMQKLCYFSSVLLDFDMGFFAHYYGPYSKNVAKNLQLLDNFDLIKKDQVLTGRGRLFPIFSLNDEAKDHINKIKTKYEKEYSTIKKIIELSERESMNYNILSYAAKIHYILREEDRELDDEKLIELADYYDWRLSAEQIESAKALLSGLNLVTFS